MVNLAQYFSVHGQVSDDKAESFGELVNRWKQLADRRAAVIEAIHAGSDLPSSVPTIECATLNTPVKMLDLRGIDLSGEEFGNVDLSYCCFDFAYFNGARLRGTHLQFSSFAFASFKGSIWEGVQASPISAPRANFNGARIEKTFMMRSDLEGIDLNQCHMSVVRFVGSNLEQAVLAPTHLIESIDISGALMQANEVTQAWVESPGVVGRPVWVGREPTILAAVSDVDTNPSQHFNWDLLVDLDLISPLEVEANPGQTSTAMPSVTGFPAHDNKRRRVLVVDDSAVTREASNKMLAGSGVDVYFAESGLEALTRTTELQPDLVLMDIEMPNMNGLEAVRHLRNEPATLHLPVIMMSAQVGKYEYQLLNAGVQGFVAKPFNKIDLLARVEKWIAVLAH